MSAPAGARVRVITVNGGRVEGVLLRAADVEYGSHYPSVKTDDGWVFHFAHSTSIAPSGQQFSPIGRLQSMTVIG